MEHKAPPKQYRRPVGRTPKNPVVDGALIQFGETQTDRAARAGISRRSVQKIDYISTHRDDLRARVAAGEMRLEAAYREARGQPKRTSPTPEWLANFPPETFLDALYLMLLKHGPDFAAEVQVCLELAEDAQDQGKAT